MINFAVKRNLRSILTLGVIAGLSACPTTTLPTGTWPVLYPDQEVTESRSDVAQKNRLNYSAFPIGKSVLPGKRSPRRGRECHTDPYKTP